MADLPLLFRIWDLRDHGNHRALRFAEKRDKVREISVRYDLEGRLAADFGGARLGEAPMDSGLFRAGQWGGRSLTDHPLSPHGVERLLKSRLKASSLPVILSSHSSRVLLVTDLLKHKVPLKDVQHLASQAHPRTTQIYDRHR